MHEAKTLTALIETITAPTRQECEYGDVIETKSVDHKQVRNILWELRSYIVNDLVMWYDIFAHEIEGDDVSGWNAETYRESPLLEFVSCPLEYIDVPWASTCFEWRQRVYDWHHEQQEMVIT